MSELVNTSAERIHAAAARAVHVPAREPELGELLDTRFSALQDWGERHGVTRYTARDREFERSGESHSDGLVDLYVLPRLADDPPERLELFLLEHEAAAKLSNPNITRALELIECRGAVIRVVEHRGDAMTLRELLNRTAWLDVDQTTSILYQIATALEHAHQKGVMHLELSPEHILVDPAGTTILTGFGIDCSRQFQWAHRLKSARASVHYASPERLSGMALDARSDLYSAGVLLFEMLTDRTPFSGEDVDAIRRKQLAHPPSSPQLFRADAPDELCEIAVRLLDRSRDNRIPSVSALLGRLDSLLAELPLPDLVVDTTDSNDAAVDLFSKSNATDPVAAGLESATPTSPAAIETWIDSQTVGEYPELEAPPTVVLGAAPATGATPLVDNATANKPGLLCSETPELSPGEALGESTSSLVTISDGVSPQPGHVENGSQLAAAPLAANAFAFDGSRGVAHLTGYMLVVALAAIITSVLLVALSHRSTNTVSPEPVMQPGSPAAAPDGRSQKTVNESPPVTREQPTRPTAAPQRNDLRNGRSTGPRRGARKQYSSRGRDSRRRRYAGYGERGLYLYR